jgi:hypothetical protein
MRKLLKRWYVWLGLVLLLGLAGSVAVVYANPSRITQANFERIQEGMSESEVTAILGDASVRRNPIAGREATFVCYWFDSSPIKSWVIIGFADWKASVKDGHFATTRETLQWYAKKGAEKIGVKWD